MTWVLTHPRNLVSHSMTDGISAYAVEFKGRLQQAGGRLGDSQLVYVLFRLEKN